ncbi:TPA: molecular chaperone [Kluyvera ascorbata]|nr:molecular chaperone [Kluyvera ascorbata]
MRRITLFALCWLAVIVVFARYAISATLQVAPVMLNLNATQRATALYLTNTGSEPIHAQIRVYDWSQSQGKDVLTLTDDIVSSPAVTALKPGQQQLVRIVVLNPMVHPQEQSFRLLVDELPGGHQAGTEQNGVHFLLRYSIPLFIASEQTESKAEDTQLTCTRQDASISCQNKGTVHIRLSHVEAIDAQRQVAETLSGLAGYVLPGQRFVLPFKQLHRHPPTSLRAYLNEHTQASLLNVHSAAVASVDDPSR